MYSCWCYILNIIPSKKFFFLNLQLQGQGVDSEGQGVTLSAVRKLQSKLHHLEQTLLHTGTPTSAAGAAAPHVGEILQNSPHSGSHGDFACDLEDLRSPGAEGASGGNMEIRMKNFESALEAEHSHRHGQDDDLEAVRHPHPSSREQEEARWPSSLPHRSAAQRSLLQGRSKRLPLTHRTSQTDQHRHAASDYNRNATTELPPECVNSKKGPVGPKVVDLALQGMMLGKEGAEPQTTQVRERPWGEASVNKPQPTAPHLSMSKRQLLDEIRREKDEHRKNVR